MSLICPGLKGLSSLIGFNRRERPIKSSPEKLRRLEEDSPDAASNTRAAASIDSSATIDAPHKAFLSATLLKSVLASEHPTEVPHSFKKGHGICYNTDLMKRCLDHDSDEDVKTVKEYAQLGRKVQEYRSPDLAH
jgi:hypothetical protein